MKSPAGRAYRQGALLIHGKDCFGALGLASRFSHPALPGAWGSLGHKVPQAIRATLHNRGDALTIRPIRQEGFVCSKERGASTPVGIHGRAIAPCPRAGVGLAASLRGSAQKHPPCRLHLEQLKGSLRAWWGTFCTAFWAIPEERSKAGNIMLEAGLSPGCQQPHT